MPDFSPFLAFERGDRQTHIVQIMGVTKTVAALSQTGRTVILGATGKLGRMICRNWAQDRTRKFVKVSRKPIEGHAVWAPGQDSQSLGKVDAVIALWGVTSGDPDALEANRYLAIKAMELGAEVQASRVLHCSSAAVYQPQDYPLSEAARLAPLHPYGQSKLAMEQDVLNWAAENPDGPKPCLMRIANVVGADSLFAAFDREDDITLDQFANGHGPMRSYLTVSDLAHCLKRLSECPVEALPLIVNIATPGAMAMSDLAVAAGRKIIWRPAPETAVPHVELATARIAAVPGVTLNPKSAMQMIADWQNWSVSK